MFALPIQCNLRQAETTALCLSHAEGDPDCVAGHVAARADLIRAHCEAGSSQIDTRAIAVYMSQI